MPRCMVASPLVLALALAVAPFVGRPAHGAGAPPLPGVTEIVPTARVRPAEWQYTFDPPAANWASPEYDSSAWKTGRSGFGSPGTPAVVVNTGWNTRDIWMRRRISLPTRRFDPSQLQLLVFNDEDVEIYIDGVLAARRNGFVREYEASAIAAEAGGALRSGATILLAVHCRQSGGGQGIDVGLATVDPQVVATIRRRREFRDFAMFNPGDPAAGKKLFLDEQRLACSRCHTTDGSSARAGPDLIAVGDKFPRVELINAVLEPSAQIAVGYASTVVTTKADDIFVGIVKEADDIHVGLMTGDGKLQRIPAAEVRNQRTQSASLMPQELEAGLSQREFADLVEYLVSLRLPAVADAGRQGMPSPIAELNPPVGLTPIHGDTNRFNHPCWFGQIPGEPNVFLVCEHETGHIWRLSIAPRAESKTLWGDFRREIRPGGATGLLGLAFHPRFRENRKYYIQHQLVVGGRIVARVSEKPAAEDLTRDSGTPSRTIVEVPCSTDVHTGGGIEFGPGGLLYIGMGDTGPQGDPQGHGQDLRTLLGKMLRIDVDRSEGALAYAVPVDNPFRGRPDARPEIWAYGFREPWRFSFDVPTGDLWVGDVGQDRIEEVGIVGAGENHGWNVYEGFDLFSTRFRTEGAPSVPPVFAYNRRLGNSITGGYVYRTAGGADQTAAVSPFEGMYVCADFTSRRVWGLKHQDRKLTAAWQLCRAPQSVASFGRDRDGALYLVGYEGTIYRLDFGVAAAAAAGMTANFK